MKKIKVKGKWQYFDGDRRITEAEFNAPKKQPKEPKIKKEQEPVEADKE